jgi:hypothetical protein
MRRYFKIGGLNRAVLGCPLKVGCSKSHFKGTESRVNTENSKRLLLGLKPPKAPNIHPCSLLKGIQDTVPLFNQMMGVIISNCFFQGPESGAIISPRGEKQRGEPMKKPNANQLSFKPSKKATIFTPVGVNLRKNRMPID